MDIRIGCKECHETGRLCKKCEGYNGCKSCKPCSNCDGGYINAHIDTCPECRNGKVPCDCNGGVEGTGNPFCPMCSGAEIHNCPACDGLGYNLDDIYALGMSAEKFDQILQTLE